MKIKSMLALAVLAPLAATAQLNLLTNGGFELDGIGAHSPFFPADPLSAYTTTTVPGWQTTAPDARFEIWPSGFSFNGSAPYNANVGVGPLLDGGTRFAELNANFNSTLFQDVTIINPLAAGFLEFSFLHRGRLGGAGQNDVLRFTVTDLSIPLAGGNPFSQDFSADSTHWVHNSGFTSVAAVFGHSYRFSYDSLTAFGGDQTFGNFLDNAAFGVGILSAVPEPSTYGLIAALSMVGVVFARRFIKSKKA